MSIHRDFGHGMVGHGGWWLIGLLLMVAFWGAVIWLVVVATRRLGGGTDVARGSAEAILAERFARGEIDADEYRTRLSALRDTRRS